MTVSTLEELLQAIDQAEDGTGIGLAGLIDLEADTVLGSPDKTITIQRIDTGDYPGLQKEFEDGPTSIKIQNIIFHGAEIWGHSSFVRVCTNISLENVTFKNCYSDGGGAFSQAGGSAYLTNCVFDNNRSSIGGHIYACGDILHLNNCTFTNGNAVEADGALFWGSDGMINIENCAITQNHADNRDGGIGCAYSGLASCIVI